MLAGSLTMHIFLTTRLLRERPENRLLTSLLNLNGMMDLISQILQNIALIRTLEKEFMRRASVGNGF